MNTTKLYIKILFPLLGFPNFFLSQTGNVGFNTDEPQALFHLDAKGDTSTSLNLTDDTFIDTNGNVGIGTYPSSDPSIKLKLNGKLKLIDGKQSEGKILVCNSDLIAIWENKTLGNTINGNGNIHEILSSAPNITTNSTYMGANITLPPGKWLINFTAVYHNPLAYSINIIWDLCSSRSVNDSSTRLGRTYSHCAPPSTYSPVNGVYIVNHSVPTTYYIWGGGANFAGQNSIPYTDGGALWAILISE